MKDSLVLPLLFALTFVVIFVLLVGGVVMYLWDVEYTPYDPPSVQWVIANLPRAAWRVFPIAAIGALFITLLRITRRPGVPVFSFLLLLFSGAILLYFGTFALARIAPGPKNLIHRSYTPLVPGVFNPLERGASVYPQMVNGTTLTNLLTVDSAANPAFHLYHHATFDRNLGQINLTHPAGAVKVIPQNPYFSPVYTLPSVLASVAGDTAVLNEALYKAYASSRVLFAVGCGGIILFAAACMLFARLTVWPLFNALMVVLAFRGLLWLDVVLESPTAAGVAKLVIPPRFLSVSSSIGLAGIAVLLILWQLLFVRTRRA